MEQYIADFYRRTQGWRPVIQHETINWQYPPDDIPVTLTRDGHPYTYTPAALPPQPGDGVERISPWDRASILENSYASSTSAGFETGPTGTVAEWSYTTYYPITKSPVPEYPGATTILAPSPSVPQYVTRHVTETRASVSTETAVSIRTKNATVKATATATRTVRAVATLTVDTPVVEITAVRCGALGCGTGGFVGLVVGSLIIVIVTIMAVAWVIGKRERGRKKQAAAGKWLEDGEGLSMDDTGGK